MSVRPWVVLCVALSAFGSTRPGWAQPAPGRPVSIPTRYVEHLWYVRPVTLGGDTLSFLTDTGGGTDMLLDHMVGRLALAPDTVATEGRPVEFVAVPGWRQGAWIPAPSPEGPGGGRLLVVPYEGAEVRRIFPPAADGLPEDAGFLSRWWFADRVWTFDYPNRHLQLRAPGDWPAHGEAHRVRLGFQLGSAGRRTTHFPRIRVLIDGDSLDLLFDTGAQTTLTDAAREEVGDGGASRRATSFITASVFERWRRAHPEWRVVERAEAGTQADMIEVPQIEVAGHSVGPVWFTRRPDAAFHEWMSQWMDHRIEGALGGSALRYFRVTADYPNAVAIFERP